MMAMSPPAVNGISHTSLDTNGTIPPPSLSITGININQPGPESDVRHEPLRAAIEKTEIVSTKPTVGTPVDPDSIPISPPKGTPPPPVGQLLEDVQMAEQASPTTPVNGIATNGVLPKTELTDVEMSAPPPTTNGIHAHATPDTQDSVASPQDTSKPQSTLPSSVSEPSSSAKDTPEVTVASNSLPNNLTRDAPSMDADDDSQPPTKRARRLSDADRASLDHTVNGHTRSATPIPPPTTAPPSPPDSSWSSISADQYRFSKHAIRTLKKMKDASPFLNPVDAVALGIPHYYTVIKQPMDLSTVEKKLDNSNPSKPAKSDQPRYYHIDEFAKEVRLIFQNCVTFNGAEHPISQMGKRVEAVFTKQLKQMPPAEEMPKPAAVPVAKPTLPVAPPPLPVKKVEKAEKPPAPARRTSMSVPTIRRSDTEVPGRPKREIHPPAPKDLPYADPPKKPRRTKDRKDDGTADQLRFCGKILSDLQKKQYWNCASPFYDPVDWVALNIPSYPKIIKKPMDFSTMKKKLEKGEYSNASKFHADFKLMLRNCFTFNPAGSSVNEAGQELQRVFDEKWAALPPLRERSESEGEDEEDEEEDDDDEKSRIVSMMKTQIEVLQRNLSAIDSKKVKKKEKKEKRDKYASSSAGPSKSSSSKAQPTGKSSSSSKKGKKVADDDVLSFEQKKDLSETIATLDGPKLEKVIQIIHEGVPEIRDSTEEIELDIDQLPSSVLTKLYNYVLRPLRPAPKRSRGTGGGTGGLKRKSMDEDAEAERIRKLEQRIALFDDKNGSAPGASARRDDDSVHSSEESSDDSSGSDSD